MRREPYSKRRGRPHHRTTSRIRNINQDEQEEAYPMSKIMYRANIDTVALRVGHKRARGRCAVVYALKDRNPQLKHIIVDGDEIRFTDSDTKMRFCFVTPANIAEFIATWDRGEETNGLWLGLPQSLLKWARPMRERTARDLVRPVEVNQQLMIDRPKRRPDRRTAQRPLALPA